MRCFPPVGTSSGRNGVSRLPPSPRCGNGWVCRSIPIPRLPPTMSNPLWRRTSEVRRTAASPVVTLVLKAKDPAFAVKLLTSAYGLADGNLRAQSLQRAQQRLDFLQDYLTKTTLEDYRRELALALVDQVRTLMAGKLPAAFAVYVISQPWSTDYPTEPTARVVLAFAVFVGLAFAAFTIFVFPAKRPQRLTRTEPALGPVEELP